MPSSTPAVVVAGAGAGYTSIPISGVDALTRSIQNLGSSFSGFRPLSEFLPIAVPYFGITPPPSLATANLRLRRNAGHFRFNYAAILVVAAFLALLFFKPPVTVILVTVTAFLWLVLHFFREDPLVVCGRDVSDFAVLALLVVVTALEVWLTGCFWSLVGGVAAGVAVAAVHGLLRNEEGVYLDEEEAASWGLIGSGSSSLGARK